MDAVVVCLGSALLRVDWGLVTCKGALDLWHLLDARLDLDILEGLRIEQGMMLLRKFLRRCYSLRFTGFGRILV